jgi:hypothetical protein
MDIIRKEIIVQIHTTLLCPGLSKAIVSRNDRRRRTVFYDNISDHSVQRLRRYVQEQHRLGIPVTGSWKAEPSAIIHLRQTSGRRI